jgi:hypothetical protein
MKKILFAVLLLGFCSATFARNVVAEGKTFSALGDYKIETTDNPILMKGQDCKAYLVSYANSPLEVTVVVCKDRKCKRFVVLSDKLSVQYVCNQDYFGVERLDKSFEEEGYTTNDSELNKLEYFHQKVLGPGQKGDLEATQLVAAYFPFLLNTPDNNSAAK